MFTRHEFRGILYALLLCAFILPAVLWSQSVQYKIPLRAADNGSGDTVVWFGVHPQGGSCLDLASWYLRFAPCDSLVVWESPPSGQTPWYDVNFTDPLLLNGSCNFVTEKEDVHLYTSHSQIDTFYLKFSAGEGGFPFTFSWPSDLSTVCDSIRLKDPFNGIITNVNMLTQSSYVLTRSTLSSLMIFMFHPKTTPPTTPTPGLTFPSNGAVGVDTNVTFMWTPVTGLLQWSHIQVAKDSSFTKLVVNDTVSVDSQVVRLAPKTKYYWRVQSIGSYVWSCYQGSPSSFITTVSPPAVPTLLAPPANDTTVATHPTFRWNKVPNADNYRVQVSANQNFTTTILDTSITDTTLQAGTFQNCISYFWHVVANTGAVSSGYSSPPRKFTVVSVIPAAPRPSSPRNGDTVQIPTTLHWTPLDPCSKTFHVQVAADSNFSVLLTDITITDTTTQLSSLQNCVSYYWHVGAGGAAGASAYSETRKFTGTPAVPAVPPLVSPNNNDTVQTTPTLHWTLSDPCTKSFRLQVARDSNFSVIVLDTTLTDTTLQMNPLSNCLSYYWHVAAKNPVKGQGSYTNKRKFVVIPVIPSPPQLVLPNNTDTVQVTPTLRWTSSDLCTKSYHLQLATDSNFLVSTVVFDTVTSGTTYSFGTQLQTGTIYFWRVSAVGSAGPSGFAMRHFLTVTIGPPAVPVAISPLDNASSVPLAPVFKWSAVYQADTYRLQVALDLQFKLLVYDDSLITDTSKQIPAISSCSQFYWRVQSKNVVAMSAFTSPRSFGTVVFIPATPSVVSPRDGSTGVGLLPTFTWTRSYCTSTYYLQVAFDQNFDNLVYNDSTIADTLKQIPAVASCSQYYWRVRAKNTTGTSPFTAAQAFQTVVLPPDAPRLFRPRNDSMFVPNQPMLSWNGPNCTTNYELQVATDSGFANKMVDDSTIQITSWQQFSYFDGRTTYYWRVRGHNESGWGAWSQIWHFKITFVGPANWLIPFAVCETGGQCDTVYFGVRPLPGVTYGIDPGLNEFQLPPPTPGVFDIRFIDIPSRPNLLGEGVRTDILPFHFYTDVDSYRVKFETGFGSYPIQISWPHNLTDTVCDSMVLKDEFGGNNVYASMGKTSSVAVMNETISSLYILVYHPLPFTSVKQVAAPLPKGYTLSRNYPNPFNPTTRIDFTAEHAAQVRLTVFDMLGREIMTLVNGTYQPGVYAVSWDGRSASGMQMPSGVYYVRMLATDLTGNHANTVSTRKMLMIK